MSRIRHAFAFVHAAEALVLLVMVLAFADNLFASVAERQHQFAVLRALGITRRQVALLLGQEAMLLGLVSAAVGLVLGAVVALSWLRLHLTSLVGFGVTFHFPVRSSARATVAAAAVAALAVLMPAWRAANLTTLRALRDAP